MCSLIDRRLLSHQCAVKNVCEMISSVVGSINTLKKVLYSNAIKQSFLVFDLDFEI